MPHLKIATAALASSIDVDGEPRLIVSTIPPKLMQTLRNPADSKLDLSGPAIRLRQELAKTLAHISLQRNIFSYATAIRTHGMNGRLDLISVPFSMSTFHAHFGKEGREKWKLQQMFLSSRLYKRYGYILISERVPSFSDSVCHKVLDLYYPSIESIHNLNAWKNFVSTKHALFNLLQASRSTIRPYLGKRRKIYPPLQCATSAFKSFPLYIDRMEAMGLYIELYSSMMAETLAVFYWVCMWDARGIQFILAPARDSSKKISSETLGKHTIWIDHMDECRPMSMTRRGVEQAVWAFLMNDPYCPRPGKQDPKDKANWVVFRQAFLRKSRELLKEKDLWLADYWIEKVEDWGSNDLL